MRRAGVGAISGGWWLGCVKQDRATEGADAPAGVCDVTRA